MKGKYQRFAGGSGFGSRIFETDSHYVSQAGLELSIIKLSWNTEGSSCLSFLNIINAGMSHHPQPARFMKLTTASVYENLLCARGYISFYKQMLIQSLPLHGVVLWFECGLSATGSVLNTWSLTDGVVWKGQITSGTWCFHAGRGNGPYLTLTLVLVSASTVSCLVIWPHCSCHVYPTTLGCIPQSYEL